jgi:DNA-binding Xre family transcriptional regulator
MLRLRVKEVAIEKGFNMSSLSRASDISFKTVKKLFREPFSDVNISTLDKLALAMQVEIHDLLERVPDTDEKV